MENIVFHAPAPKPISYYGIFTDFSKALNQALGDDTNRSVSRRTAQGLIELVKAYGLEESVAEDLVHGLMGINLALYSQKNTNLQLMGGALTLFLAICYWRGRAVPQPQPHAQVVQWDLTLRRYNTY